MAKELIEILLEGGAITAESDTKEEQESGAKNGRLKAGEAALPEPQKAAPFLASNIVGKLRALTSSGEPLVQVVKNDTVLTLRARSTIKLSQAEVGKEVVLLAESGDINKLIVVGVIQHPGALASENGNLPAEAPLSAELDGERVVLSAKREIVLRCGKASITLTRAGKILIRGAYLLSRSSGVNRIKGGSVQIN
ncbi:MAG: DUF6484 domain-containing protein [bacterium]